MIASAAASRSIAACSRSFGNPETMRPGDVDGERPELDDADGRGDAGLAQQVEGLLRRRGRRAGGWTTARSRRR